MRDMSVEEDISLIRGLMGGAMRIFNLKGAFTGDVSRSLALRRVVEWFVLSRLNVFRQW